MQIITVKTCTIGIARAVHGVVPFCFYYITGENYSMGKYRVDFIVETCLITYEVVDQSNYEEYLMRDITSIMTYIKS